MFFYNIFNPQLKLHDSDWVQPNLDIKYMTDINDFIKFSGKKYIFCDSGQLYASNIINFIIKYNLHNYVLIHDHDAVLRNTNPNRRRRGEYNPMTLSGRNYWRAFIPKLRFKSILAVSKYNIPLYSKINVNCEYHLPYSFCFAHEKLKENKANKTRMCGCQRATNSLIITKSDLPSNYNLISCTGTYETVLNKMLSCKYFLHLDTLNKYEDWIAYGEGGGRQCLEAVILNCIPISIKTYLYKHFIDDFFFIKNVKEIKHKIIEIDSNIEKYEIEQKKMSEDMCKEFSSENFFRQLDIITNKLDSLPMINL